MFLGFRKAVWVVLLILSVSACTMTPVYIDETAQAEGQV